MNKGIQNRNRIANQLSIAADETDSAEFRRSLRDAVRRLMADKTSGTDENIDSELIRLSGELEDYVKKGQLSPASKCLERIDYLMKKRTAPAAVKEGGTKMSLKGKIKDAIGRGSKIPTEEKMESQLDSNLFELEKKIAEISAQHETEMDKLKQMVQQAASLDPSSMEYRQLRTRASGVKKQIQIYENQINAYFNTLMNNQTYLQMIENGKAMKDLSSFIPDSTEADFILGQIDDTLNNIKDQDSDFSDILHSYEGQTSKKSSAFQTEDNEFDQEVAKLRGDNENSSADDKKSGVSNQEDTAMPPEDKEDIPAAGKEINV